MKIELTPVGIDEKEILRNLLEKYNYEFSQYDLRDVNSLGLFGNKYLDCYWIEKNRWAFFIKADGKLAGFAMVIDIPEIDEKTDYTLAEFFVLYKYRRQGVGRFAAFTLFDRFKGRWLLRYHPKNIASAHFWNRIVGEYTNGNYTLMEAHPEAMYDDGTPGDFLLFNSR